jgi:hypothetical protein
MLSVRLMVYLHLLHDRLDICVKFLFTEWFDQITERLCHLSGWRSRDLFKNATLHARCARWLAFVPFFEFLECTNA